MADREDEEAGARRQWAALPQTQLRLREAEAYAEQKHNDVLYEAGQSTDPMVRACAWAYAEAQRVVELLKGKDV